MRLLTTPAERFERSIGRNLKRSEQTATPAKTSAASVSAAFALTDRVPPIQTARPKASNASIQKRNRGPRNSPLTSKSPYKQLPIVYPGSALSSKSSFLATIRDNTGQFILVSCLNHVTRLRRCLVSGQVRTVLPHAPPNCEFPRHRHAGTFGADLLQTTRWPVGRLVAFLSQPEIGTNIPRSAKPLDVLDRRSEGQRRDRSNARHAHHQPPRDRVAARQLLERVVEPHRLRFDRHQGFEQRLDADVHPQSRDNGRRFPSASGVRTDNLGRGCNLDWTTN